jgi:hypothetical protein
LDAFALASVEADVLGVVAATAEMSVTVPRKTVSSDWSTAQVPGGSLEQVQE